MAIGGKGKLVCHPKGLTVEGQRVSQAGPATLYAFLVMIAGSGLWWLYATHGVFFDGEALGSLMVGFTLMVGGVLRQLPTGEPLLLEIPWRSVVSLRVRGRKLRITVRDFEPAGELCLVATGDPEALLTKWRRDGIGRV